MELGVQRSDALRKVAAQLADASDDVSLTKVLVTALFAYLYRASGNEIVGMRVTLNDRMPESANGVVSGSARQCPVQVTVDAEDSFSTLYAKTSQELDTVGRHVQSAPSEWSDELNYAVSFDLDEIRAREFNGVPVTMRLSRSPLAGPAVRNHNPASSALAARPASANAPAVSQQTPWAFTLWTMVATNPWFCTWSYATTFFTKTSKRKRNSICCGYWTLYCTTRMN